jgi:ABC-type glutathione transport system ATPase component
MQARLTFSTAISVDPDILIIDEALSVGDARFQAKCFARIKKLRDSNTTILLVSHDTGTITSLCDRAIILEAGKIYAEGNAKEISIAYHNLLFGNRSKNLSTGNEEFQKAQKYKDITTQSFVRYGTGEAQIESWEVLDEDSKPSAVLITGSKFKLAMTFLSKADISDLTFGFAIKDTRGTVLWGVTNMSYFERPNFVSDGEKIRVFADCTLWLSAGHYTVSLGLAHLEDGEKIDFIEDALVIRVVGPGRIFTTSVVNLDTTLHIISC